MSHNAELITTAGENSTEVTGCPVCEQPATLTPINGCSTGGWCRVDGCLCGGFFVAADTPVSGGSRASALKSAPNCR